MSKNVAVFIDVANIYYAARGQDVDVDYIALLKHATKGRDLIRAYAYSGLDPENENQRKFLDFLSKNGYKVVHKDIRKFGDGRVKANLDIELVVDLFRLAPRMDYAVIVSGDGDFASAIRALQDVGVRCEVISFRPNTSSDLIAVADEFTDIMKITGIGRGKASKVMSMPEMPAKEVNPEFGFREASRGVAAAALAALREGEKAPPRAGRRRGSRSAEPQPVDAEAAAVVEAVEAAAVAMSAEARPGDEGRGENGDGRRRRRRRGGRGRGRGRREEMTGDGGEAPSEPTWQEFDDVAALGELTDLGEPGDEERGYTFEEADAETLAELGLEAPAAEPAFGSGASRTPTDDGAGAEVAPTRPRRATRSRRGAAAADVSAAETAAESAPDAAAAGEVPAATSPRRGRRTRAAGGEVPAVAEVADGGEAPAPARRSRGRRAASATTSGEDAQATAAPTGADAPATDERPRRRRPRSASTGQPAEPAGDGSATSAEAAGEEGIWQRFRSARRTPRRPA